MLSHQATFAQKLYCIEFLKYLLISLAMQKNERDRENFLAAEEACTFINLSLEFFQSLGYLKG